MKVFCPAYTSRYANDSISREGLYEGTPEGVKSRGWGEEEDLDLVAVAV